MNTNTITDAKIDSNVLDALQTAEQIDQFLAGFYSKIENRSQDDYDSWAHNTSMRREEFHALEFLYQTWFHHITDDACDRSYLNFIVRYDQTHPNATYVYYPEPTITPSVCKTTLQQVLIDCVMFDADFADYKDILQHLADADFIEISVRPSITPLEYRYNAC